MTVASPQTPIETTDPINRRILEVSEDQLQGFQRDPIGAIAEQTELERGVIIERLRAMLAGGSIRRIRQTMLATNLAKGALVAWEVSQDKLDAAFDYLFQQDPFSGHVVTRSTDPASPGSTYRLWTTLKGFQPVPSRFSPRAMIRLKSSRQSTPWRTRATSISEGPFVDQDRRSRVSRRV